MRNLFKSLTLAAALAALSGCVGGDPVDVPEAGFYRNKPSPTGHPRTGFGMPPSQR